nr:Mrp/NBP35 family ATP-binding protein [Erythrobacter litoralis]
MAEAERSGFEERVRSALLAEDDIADVRIASTAQRTARTIIAIGSGKGGVGKSTLTANLAVALARQGVKIGLVDADIYGPSQPVIFGVQGTKPTTRDEKLVPVETPFGVPLLSMGQLVAPGKALAWRGPMAGGALTQLMDAAWGETEVLLVDLPPGTGDVQLTMLQKFKPAGAVLVSTPQDLALIDAARAGQLFDAGGVPVIGLVENMAGYACPHCGEVSDPFGAGGVEAAAERLELPFLGRIPLDLAIRQGSDGGKPPAAGDDAVAAPFADIAKTLREWLSARR